MMLSDVISLLFDDIRKMLHSVTRCIKERVARPCAGVTRCEEGAPIPSQPSLVAPPGDRDGLGMTKDRGQRVS